jgi:hypothetical protein
LIEIVSYLRSPGGDLTRIEEALSAPRDPTHVEGALEMTIDGVRIVDTTSWDCIDGLWAYIADMIGSLRRTGEATTLFPDQPIRLSFRRQGKRRVLVTFDARVPTNPKVPTLIRIPEDQRFRAATVDEEELVLALREHGKLFFDKMISLLPERRRVYEHSLTGFTE